MMQSECDLGLRPRGLRGPGLRGSLVLSGFASGVLTWRVAAGAAVEAEKRIAAAKFEEMRGKLESMEELVKLAGVDGDGRGACFAPVLRVYCLMSAVEAANRLCDVRVQA